MTAHFITSSGTDIGKTLVTASLAWQLRERGQAVRALKPVISGFTSEDAAESDSGVILASLGEDPTEEAIRRMTPWQFAAALAPDLAAAREGRTLDLAEVIGFCLEEAQSAEREDATLLVEGVGGLMAPMTQNQTVADWITALGFPAILVVGSYLGTISHTLTAVESLDARAIPVSAVIVSESDGSTVPLDETIESLGRFLPDRNLIVLPRVADTAEPWRAAADLTGALV